MNRRSPLLAATLTLAMVSLAGIPPLAGFFGKFYLFAAVLKPGASSLGLLWLVVLAIAMSAVSFYYYLKVLKQIYVVDGPNGADATNVSPLAQAVLLVMAVLVILLGCFPNLLVGCLQACLKAIC